MDLKILKKQDNPLLSRVEIEAELSFSTEPTPKKEDVKKKLCSMEKADEKLVVIKKISGVFGVGLGKVLAYVYTSEDELKKTEPKKKEKKGAKPEEGEAKEAVKETPKEEAKEAPKEEAKK